MKQACKNSQQNTSKENSAIYQKDKSPWTSGLHLSPIKSFNIGKVISNKIFIWKGRYETEDREVASSYQKLEDILFDLFLAQWWLNCIDFTLWKQETK